MGVVVYTAIYGGSDILRPAPSAPGVDFVCFTDDRGLQADGWEVRVIPAVPGLRPRAQAKWFKIMPVAELPGAEATLWIDGSHAIKWPGAIHEAMACVGPDGIAMHKHFARDCIYEEAEASAAFRKYRGIPVRAQARHYRREGHPANWGLWAGGSIARIWSDRLGRAMHDWWQENLAWTLQDQISLPVVMRRHGLRPAEFPHPQFCSPWFAIHDHEHDENDPTATKPGRLPR